MVRVIAGIVTVGLGVAVAYLTGDLGTGAALALGVVLGVAGSIFVVPALRAAPAGVGAAVDDSASGWAEFHRELARARRFEVPFALVRFSPGEADQTALEAIRDAVATGARRIDRLWVDGSDVIALLPASTETATQAMLARTRASVAALADVEPSVALFPEHGITSGALIAAVYGGDRNDVPTPIAAVRPESRAHGPAGPLDPASGGSESAEETVARGG